MENPSIFTNTFSRCLSLSVEEMKGLLDRSGGEIIGFTKMFPIEPAFQNFTKFLTESQKNIEAYFPQIDQLDFYRYFCKLFFWDVIDGSDNHMLLESSSRDKYIFFNFLS